MKRLWFTLLPIAILGAAFGIRVADPGPVQTLRLAVFDQYQRLAPRAYEDAPVRVVSVDDDSLARLGQWPWPRTLLADLVRRLGELGAAAIAFDMVFAEPDRTSPAQILPLWGEAAHDPAVRALAQRVADHDAVFAAAIAEVPTVLGYPLVPDGGTQVPPAKWGIATTGDDPFQFLKAFGGALANLPALEAAAAGLGVFNVDLDPNGPVRRVPLLFSLSKDGKRVIQPSLVAEALRVAQGASTYIVKSSGASGEKSFGEPTGVNHVKIGDVEIPTDPLAQVWLYDTGPVPGRTVSAWRVLEKDFDAALIDGRIIFVGAGAAGLLDLRATPLDPAAPGVTVNAQILEQILLGRHLERPDWTDGAEWAFLVLFGAGVIYILPRRGATWGAIVAILAVGAAFATSWGAFVRFGLLFDPLYPSAAVLMLYLVQSLLVYLRTEGERQQVRAAFSSYLSPAVVERVARDPTLLRLGGENRDMTVLFCDVRNFTRMSERLDATAVTA